MSTIYEVLNQLGIQYVKHEHPAVFTCEQADELAGHVPGGRSKNLFLRNQKGDKHYLFVAFADKRADLKTLTKLVGESRLSFASEDRLMKYLNLTPGSVSPFGLINDTNHEVIVLIDNELMKHETLGFHPNVNTATLEITSTSFKEFLEATGNDVRYIHLA